MTTLGAEREAPARPAARYFRDLRELIGMLGPRAQDPVVALLPLEAVGPLERRRIDAGGERLAADAVDARRGEAHAADLLEGPDQWRGVPEQAQAEQIGLELEAAILGAVGDGRCGHGSRMRRRAWEVARMPNPPAASRKASTYTRTRCRLGLHHRRSRQA